MGLRTERQQHPCAFELLHHHWRYLHGCWTCNPVSCVVQVPFFISFYFWIGPAPAPSLINPQRHTRVQEHYVYSRFL